jgi:hypothetical protein
MGQRNIVSLRYRHQIVDIAGVPIRIKALNNAIENPVAITEVLNTSIDSLLPW